MLHSSDYIELATDLYFHIFTFLIILYFYHIIYRKDKIRKEIEKHVNPVLEKDSLYSNITKTGANDTNNINVLKNASKRNFELLKEKDKKLKYSFIIYSLLGVFAGIVIILLRKFNFNQFKSFFYKILTSFCYFVLLKIAFIHNIVRNLGIIEESKVYNDIATNINNKL